MNKSRLEAFSDGVLAIIITIMVLDLKVPHEEGLAALRSLMPVLLRYALSFVYVGIRDWNNHHHMLHATRRVTGAVLWANLHLLFWLSLFPFVTGWVGEHPSAVVPAALYGVVLEMSGIAYRASPAPSSPARAPQTRRWRERSATTARAECRCCSTPSRFRSPWSSLYLARALCGRGADVAGSRPAHREDLPQGVARVARMERTAIRTPLRARHSGQDRMPALLSASASPTHLDNAPLYPGYRVKSRVSAGQRN